MELFVLFCFNISAGPHLKQIILESLDLGPSLLYFFELLKWFQCAAKAETYWCRGVLFRLNMLTNDLKSLLKCNFCLVGLRWGPWFCLSHLLPGNDTDAAIQRSARLWMLQPPFPHPLENSDSVLKDVLNVTLPWNAPSHKKTCPPLFSYGTL